MSYHHHENWDEGLSIMLNNKVAPLVRKASFARDMSNNEFCRRCIIAGLLKESVDFETRIAILEKRLDDLTLNQHA